MSPTNWRECPQCDARRDAQIESLDRIILEAESMSGQQFRELQQRLDKLKKAVPEESLREHYEIGTDSKGFHVQYSCSCHVCGFDYVFERQHLPIDYDLETDET